MTGYQEVLTDPSYTGQLVTMTSPHIGNTGINPEDPEGVDGKPQVAGFIVRDPSILTSNYRSEKTWTRISNATTWLLSAASTRAL